MRMYCVNFKFDVALVSFFVHLKIRKYRKYGLIRYFKFFSVQCNDKITM